MVDNIGSLPSTSTSMYMPLYGNTYNYGLTDYDNIDLDYSMYPMMGMNGSIFSAAPYMSPGVAGADQTSYFDNMKQYQKFYNDMNVEQQKMQRNADLQITGAMESIEETAANLRDKIAHNEQDQIKEAYQKYIDSVKRAYGEGNEEDINSRAMALYRRLTGKTIVQDLRDNGHNSFLQGVFQSLTFGLFSKKSSEDNIAEITGQRVNEGEKISQNVGRIAGAGAVGTATYAILNTLAKNSQIIGSKIGSKAPIIGLAAGIISATLSFITGRATT